MFTLRRAIQLQSHASKYNHYMNTYSINSIVKNIRNFSAAAETQPSELMHNLLQKKFPKATKIEVNDLSGGCGSMYEIFVESIEFKGVPLVKQHRLINETLKDQIKNMHGLTVRTKVPE